MEAPLYETKDSRGLSFCETISSSKSSHRSSNGSLVDEESEDGSSSDDGIGSSGSILHEDDDDKSSRNDGDEQDCHGFEEKIRWLFLSREEKQENGLDLQENASFED